MKRDFTLPIVIILIIMIIIYASLIFYIFPQDGYNRERSYIYKIEGDLSSEGDCILLVPIPMIYSRIMYDISDLKVIYGNATIQYNNTIHGPALKIETKESFQIEGKIIEREFTHFSLEKDNVTIDDSAFWGKHSFRIYLNSTENMTINLFIYCGTENYEYNYPSLRIYENISNGWQLITGKYGKLVV